MDKGSVFAAMVAAWVVLAATGLRAAEEELPLTQRAEKVARDLQWLEMDEVLWDYAPRWGPEPEKAAAALRFVESRVGKDGENVPWPAEEIRPLLKHADPRVRTVGLILLWRLGRVDVLADMALLTRDEAETFPRAMRPSTYEPVVHWHMEPRTVGSVATEMLFQYRMFSAELEEIRPGVDEPQELAGVLRAYAAKRDPERGMAALYIALHRAIGGPGVSGMRPERMERVRHVLSRIEPIPMPQRFYMAVALDLQSIGMEGYNEQYPLMLAREVPRAMRLKTLGGQAVVDDPDISPWTGAAFMLKHASALLRREDAEMLLEVARGQPSRLRQGGLPERAPAAEMYALAAAQLVPERADEILREALRSNNTPERQVRLAMALAQTGSDRGLDEAIGWLFSVVPQRGALGGGREGFLEGLRYESPARFRTLAERVIRDERLEQLGPQSTRVLMESVRGFLGEELVAAEELAIARGVPEAQRERVDKLGDWHRRLKESVDRWAKPMEK